MMGMQLVTHQTGPAGQKVRKIYVEEGMDIARELYISEKTVANHLTAVFAKTGVENRVGAAAFAIRHGLA